MVLVEGSESGETVWMRTIVSRHNFPSTFPALSLFAHLSDTREADADHAVLGAECRSRS